MLFMNNKTKRIFLSIVLILCICSFFYIKHSVQSADHTFTQTNWNGGQTANTATHTDNQSNWTQYSAKDANLTLANSGADLQITNAPQTTEIDFNVEGEYYQQDISKTQFVNGGVMLEGAQLANGTTLGQNARQAIGTSAARDWETFTIDKHLCFGCQSLHRQRFFIRLCIEFLSL